MYNVQEFFILKTSFVFEIKSISYKRSNFFFFLRDLISKKGSRKKRRFKFFGL